MLPVYDIHESMRVPADGADAAKCPQELLLLRSRRLQIIGGKSQHMLFDGSVAVGAFYTLPVQFVLGFWGVQFRGAQQTLGTVLKQQLLRRNTVLTGAAVEEYAAEGMLHCGYELATIVHYIL